VAGIAGIAGDRDGTYSSALFNQPQALVYASTVIVADTGNSVIRNVVPQSVVTTLALKAPTTSTPGTGGTGTGSSGGGGGGGSTEAWFVALLGISGLAMLVSRRRAVHFN
jgi:hypothetical protein